MAVQRLTITLPERLAERVRKEAREKKKPVSRVIADVLAEREQEELRQLMIQGYKEASALNKQLAEEFWPIATETWPSD